ncbi:DUF3644 domain-containing protein [Leptothermofonsia sichuanensis E412]|uniref:DUF3644 domain-containing protein n=1 Tax=Leptothermofonsia sichuanensis TaxID=2917832 RepID=UPI001CA6999E|nr:DUF3644 domain-containing protein [Leptothermofonsia sichuanensis]QZZ19817.1 DUF3644 domain-containing protein [Leptothermofonsia sichuanensis E412]
MPKTLPREIKIHLEKATESALLAVDIYNKPATKFRSGGYIVLMCLAWTALFHAIFFKNGVKPFYRQKNSRKYLKVDGDYKAWELKECLQQYYKGQYPAVRKNIEFFIPLRNKLEHRSMPQLDIHIFGECQAFLFNFEDLLIQEFGSKYALNEHGFISLQFSHVRHEDQQKAIREMQKPLAREIKDYIDKFRSSLTTNITDSLQYSYKVYIIPKLSSHQNSSDLAVEFVKYDPNNPEEMKKYSQVAALLKVSQVQVANAGKLKAGEVASKVEPIVKQIMGQDAKFTASHHHVRAARYYKVRPKRGEDKRKTNPKYCHYDEAHDDYVYTDEWVNFLKTEMEKEGQYEKVMKHNE